ncbi:MAG: sigma-54-dependent transcriptional regulator [Vicinamibacterales bacterium]
MSSVPSARMFTIALNEYSYGRNPVEPTRILVVAQSPSASSLVTLLEGAGHVVLRATTGGAALAQLGSACDVVLLEDGLADMTTREAIEFMHEADPSLPIVLLTPVVLAKAVAQGAYLAVSPPYDADAVLVAVGRGVEASRLRQELRALRTATRLYSVDQLIGASAGTQRVRERLTDAAGSDSSSVLLIGERGSGKRLTATILHHASRRASRPLFSVLCTGLTDDQLASELFGHERGAFAEASERRPGLLELASEGTVVIDAIEEMGAPVQRELMRVLDRQQVTRLGGAVPYTVTARIVATAIREPDPAEDATLAELGSRFALRIALPPLRERGEDVALIASVFVERYARELHKPIRRISPAAQTWLQQYAWPGNVRELRAVIERAVLLAGGDTLDVAHLIAGHGSPGFDLPPDGLQLDALERELVGQALRRTDGNLTRAGALLGLNRDQVRYRLEKYALTKRGMAAPAKPNQPEDDQQLG